MLHEYLNPDDVAGAMPPTASAQPSAPAAVAEVQQGAVQQVAPFSMVIGTGSAPVYITLSQTVPAPSCAVTPAPAAESAAPRTVMPSSTTAAAGPAPSKNAVQQGTGSGEMDRVAAWELAALTAMVLVFIGIMAIRHVDADLLTRVSATAVSVVVVLGGVVFRKPLGRRLRGTRKVVGAAADVTIATAQIVKNYVVGETAITTAEDSDEETEGEDAADGDHPDPADPA